MQLEQQRTPGTGASLPGWMGWLRVLCCSPFPGCALKAAPFASTWDTLPIGSTDLAGESPEPGGTWH